jgi:hypothetical protein
VWIKIGVGRKAKAWLGAVGTMTILPVPGEAEWGRVEVGGEAVLAGIEGHWN